MRNRAAFLLAVLASSGSAGAEVVTFRGSGTVVGWQTFSNGNTTAGAPAALESAFPTGASFNAIAAYDTAQVATTFSNSPTATYYRGYPGFTNLSIQTSGHTFSPDPNSGWGRAAGQVLIINEPVRDFLYVSHDGLIDGGKTFAGYTVVGGNVGLTTFDGTAVLAGTELPAQICLAHWKSLDFSFGVIEGVPPDAILYSLRGTGTPDRSIDSDGDGVTDGVELLHACIDACAGATDSDGDTVLDAPEIALGSDPCSQDTDGDGLDDAVDPDPLVPGVSTDQLVETVRDTAAGVLEIPEAAFTGPNANAERGRRGALSNRLNAAANAIQDGDLAEARQILVNILRMLDGDQIMADGPEKDALRAQVEALIALVDAALAA